MDGFTYTNIFETKGIEYLVIIGFFLVLIPFWIVLNKDGKISKKIKNILNILSFDVLKVPQGIFYGKNHTWAFMEKSGSASFGLDDFLLHTTGNVNLENLRNPGEVIRKGDLLTEIRRDDKVLKIYSPISGEILRINSNLKENPDWLCDDPYGKAWIYKMKPNNWINETNSCYLAEEATNWSKAELERLKGFLAISGNKNSSVSNYAILQDGGELVDHSLSELPIEIWKDFQESFLDLKK